MCAVTPHNINLVPAPREVWLKLLPALLVGASTTDISCLYSRRRHTRRGRGGPVCATNKTFSGTIRGCDTKFLEIEFWSVWHRPGNTTRVAVMYTLEYEIPELVKCPLQYFCFGGSLQGPAVWTWSYSNSRKIPHWCCSFNLLQYCQQMLRAIYDTTEE